MKKKIEDRKKGKSIILFYLSKQYQIMWLRIENKFAFRVSSDGDQSLKIY